MRPYFLVLGIAFFLVGCSSASFVSKKIKTTQKLGMEYSISSRAPKKALVLILPEVWDTVRLDKSLLATTLLKEGYQVVIPKKPGKNTFEQREFDNYPTRLRDLTYFLDSLNIDDQIPIYALGFGTGAHILPDLQKKTRIKATIGINTGPYSLVQELEFLAASPDSLKFGLDSFISRFDLRNKEFMLAEIEKIKSPRINTAAYFAKHTYHFWNTYYNRPLLSSLELSPSKSHSFFILSEKYQYLSESSKSYMLVSFPGLNVPTYTIPGRGNFNKTSEMESLTYKVLSIIKGLDR